MDVDGIRTASAGRAAANDSFNRQVARFFRDFASLLEVQQANPFRVNAYLRAAKTLEALDCDARDLLLDGGIDALMRLPTIGQGLARSIEEIARTGRFAQLERLRGSADPVQLFRRIPGVGPVLAHRIHDTLHVDTLEALELAAHDGSLAEVPGIGSRKLAAILAGLAAVLQRRTIPRHDASARPPVSALLTAEAEYRAAAAAGSLPTIAPKRFNPQRAAWLPVLHTEAPPWHFTLLFSNTVRAHELDRTRDWVVIYFYGGDHREGQCTVVTESRGELAGRRVVRGREAECRDYYSIGPAADSTKASGPVGQIGPKVEPQGRRR